MEMKVYFDSLVFIYEHTSLPVFISLVSGLSLSQLYKYM